MTTKAKIYAEFKFKKVIHYCLVRSAGVPDKVHKMLDLKLKYQWKISLDL